MSRSLVLLGGAAALLAAAPAHADIFSARAELTGGGAGGVGVGGDQKDAAYFKNAPHGTYGALIGAQILIADAFIEFGVHAAFGLGTGQQVDPPLDNAQITDKGFLLEARVGFGKRLGHGLRLGVTIPVSGGYFFKSGNGATVNNLSTHYQGIEARALLTLGMQLGAL